MIGIDRALVKGLVLEPTTVFDARVEPDVGHLLPLRKITNLAFGKRVEMNFGEKTDFYIELCVIIALGNSEVKRPAEFIDNQGLNNKGLIV
jgi:hypothetical protein